MLAGTPTASRIVGLAGASLVLVFAAGCAGSSADQSAQTTKHPAHPAIMRGGPGRISIRGVQIVWNRRADGRVCFRAKSGLGNLIEVDGLVSCIRHLRANEITYALGMERQTRQLVIVGLKGPLVKSIYLQLLGKRWTPATSRVGFFGYVPKGRLQSVVKVLRDGTREAFPIHHYVLGAPP